MRGKAIVGLAMVAFGLGAAAPASEMARVAGVYREPFMNHMADGEPYRSVDVLRIERRGPSQAYVDVHLEFRNGHTCDIGDVAHYEAGVFSMTVDPRTRPGETCAFTLTVLPEVLKTGAKGEGCFSFCGMRGTLDGAEFKRGSRRRPFWPHG